MEKPTISIEEISSMLNDIKIKEPDVVTAIGLVVQHIHGCYSDKYAKGEEMGIDTKKMLYHPVKGKAINEYQIARYLQRYVTDGSKKSGLLKDLMKMIHYGVFEIVRRIRANQLNIDEPVV